MKASVRAVAAKALRGSGILAIFVCLAVSAHAVFVPQFFSLPFSPFTYYGGDATSQLVGAVSLLEHSLMEGTFTWNWEYGLGGDLFSNSPTTTPPHRFST